MVPIYQLFKVYCLFWIKLSQICFWYYFKISLINGSILCYINPCLSLVLFDVKFLFVSLTIIPLNKRLWFFTSPTSKLFFYSRVHCGLHWASLALFHDPWSHYWASLALYLWWFFWLFITSHLPRLHLTMKEHTHPSLKNLGRE